MKRIWGLVGFIALLTLSACNSVDPTLGMGQKTPSPSAPAAAAITTQPAPQTTQPATTSQPATQLASVNRAVRLNLAPVVGAPVSAVTALSHRLQQDARARGITMTGDNDPSTTYVLKGYFSTLSEGGSTTVLYVWDVLDPSGNRLHRIQGQQKVPGTASDPWTVVAPQTMETIGDATVEALIQWINSTPS